MTNWSGCLTGWRWLGTGLKIRENRISPTAIDWSTSLPGSYRRVFMPKRRTSLNRGYTQEEDEVLQKV